MNCISSCLRFLWRLHAPTPSYLLCIVIFDMVTTMFTPLAISHFLARIAIDGKQQMLMVRDQWTPWKANSADAARCKIDYNNVQHHFSLCIVAAGQQWTQFTMHHDVLHFCSHWMSNKIWASLSAVFGSCQGAACLTHKQTDMLQCTWYKNDDNYGI